FAGRDGDPLPPVDDARLANRLNARFDKIVGESLILKEVVLLFIRVWLEHNPPIAEAQEDAAAASAEARFQRFLWLVSQGLQAGRSLAHGSIHGETSGQAEADAPNPPPQ